MPASDSKPLTCICKYSLKDCIQVSEMPEAQRILSHEKRRRPWLT